ncbi:conserved hypothetical protein [Ricinus communis]|uniref:Uncharacterized protein n=1 Tax=Ricinus communis TaxID=3988 RepID=B9SU55_RICCO|nr:conserved hypothetical protein [Ricinus communis]
MEYTESQLIYVNGLRHLVNELRSERNEVLFQVGKGHAINDARLEEIVAIRAELEVMRETSNGLKVENQVLKEEIGLLFIKIDLLKEKLSGSNGRLKQLEQSRKCYMLRCGVVVASIIVLGLYHCKASI